MSSKSTLIIIDTDAGVDDAIALLMALDAAKRRSKDFKILAITAVAGNTDVNNVLINIHRVFDVFSPYDKITNIPVFKGASQGMVVEFEDHEHYNGKDGYNDVILDDPPELYALDEQETAVGAMTRLTRAYPGEVSIVALGPLTNVALAMQTDPQFVTNVKDFFIMGGNNEAMGNVSPNAEFNFHADPEAAYVVLNQTRCPTYIAGWELCFKHTHITLDWRQNVLGTKENKKSNFINKIENPWFAKWPWGSQWMLCDQLIMAPVIDFSCIKKQSHLTATVELHGGLTRGQVVVDRRATKFGKTPLRKNVIFIDLLDEELLKNYLATAFE